MKATPISKSVGGGIAERAAIRKAEAELLNHMDAIT